MKKQLELNIYKGRNGGPRPGAGRPRKHSKGVAHLEREKVTSRTPLHINFKYRSYIRTNHVLNILEKGIIKAQKFHFFVSHYTLQSNHIHLIAEVRDNQSLTSGMKSLTASLARGIRKGPIQTERYHLHVLRTPQEVKNALLYVLQNDLKHTGKMDRKYTKTISKGRSWLLTSSLEDIASATSRKFLYP